MKPNADLHQTAYWARFMEKIGWTHATLPVAKSQIFIKKLPLVGSIIKVLRPTHIDFPELEEAARQHRALFLKIEPPLHGPTPTQFAAQGFVPDSWPLCATRVYRIDIADNPEKIGESFSKDARYSIHRAERNGIIVETEPLTGKTLAAAKLKTFYQLFKHTGDRKGFWVPPRQELEAKAAAFAEVAFLLLAKFGEEYVSGAFVIINGQTAYYEHAAANALGRKLLAQYLVVWETIKLAKANGCQILDLGGVADPRFKISRRWQGLEVFKAKFGGEVVTYPGSYTKYYNPLIKLLFKLNI